MDKIEQIESVLEKYAKLGNAELAVFWNLDITKELTKYLQVVEDEGYFSQKLATQATQGTQTEEGEFNFRKAGFMIDNCARVWCKKVDYVESLTENFKLHLVDENSGKSKKKETDPDSSQLEPDEGGEHEQELGPESGGLDLVNLEECYGLDLDDDEGSSEHSCPEPEQTVGERFTGQRPLLVGALFFGENPNDESSEAREFRIKLASLHTASGALVLDNQDLALVNDQFEPMRLDTVLKPIGSDERAVFGGLLGNAPRDDSDSDDDEKEKKKNQNESDDESDDERAPLVLGQGFGDPNKDEGEKAAKQRMLDPERRLPEIEKTFKTMPEIDCENPWPLLDVFDINPGLSRPFKKGTTYKIPPTHKSEDPVPAFASLLEPTPSVVQACYFPEFEYLYQRTKPSKKDKPKRKKLQLIEDLDSESEVENFADNNLPPTNANPDLDQSFGAGFGGDDDNHYEPLEPQFDLLNTIENGEIVAQGAVEQPSSDVVAIPVTKWEDTNLYADFNKEKSEEDWKEFCQVQSEKYAQNMQTYLHNKAELSRKITQWRKKIDPLLQEQTEKWPQWDIGADGLGVLQRMDSHPHHDTPIGFRDVLPSQNMRSFEVSRLFASCLQLANFRNIDIVGGGEINQLQFQLLDATPFEMDQTGNPISVNSTKEKAARATKATTKTTASKKKAGSSVKPTTDHATQLDENSTENEAENDENDVLHKPLAVEAKENVVPKKAQARASKQNTKAKATKPPVRRFGAVKN